jgi:hypothetical protein
MMVARGSVPEGAAIVWNITRGYVTFLCDFVTEIAMKVFAQLQHVDDVKRYGRCSLYYVLLQSKEMLGACQVFILQ